MEKAARYHRDIYSGMVASALGKEGYFGDEYRLYGFLCWIKNEKIIITADKEEDCARIYVDLVEQGAVVTPYLSCGERVYESKKIEEIMLVFEKKIYDVLNDKYGKELEDKINEAETKPINSDTGNILKNYYLSLDASAKVEKVQALRWLAGYSKSSGLLSQEDYNNLLELLPKIDIKPLEYYKEISGFAWYDSNEWKYYINAFLPTVLEKLINFQKNGCLISGIVSQQYPLSNKPVYELKAEFQGYLSAVLDHEYLSILRKLDDLRKHIH